MIFNKNAIIVSLIILILGIIFAFCDAFYWETKSKVWMGIGCSLLASSLVILLNTLLVYSYRKDPLEEWGIEKAYNTRLEKNNDADPSLDNAHFRVDGVAFGLSAFRSKNHNRVEEALRRGVKFRFLVMNPECEFTKQRDKEENNQLGHISKTIRDLIKWADELNSKGYKGSIEIKGYSCMTLDFYWRIDDDIYVGPYWYGRPSSTTITYKFKSSKKCAQVYSEYFESIWNNPEMKKLA